MRHEPSKRVPSYFPPSSSGLAFVAQSPGKTELEEGFPLVGASGKLLKGCTEKAGIPWGSCFRGNVIGFKPPANEFSYFCGKKAEVGGKDYPLPALKSGQYLHPDWFPELERLKEELLRIKPNLVVALGNEALWALCRVSGITKYRGNIMPSTLVPGLKVLPTWHPANVLRVYENKLDLTLDLLKAKEESLFPQIKTPSREMWLYPDLDDLANWEVSEVCDHPRLGYPLISVDIETRFRKFISCIGFAFNRKSAIVVPFWSELRPDHSYWRRLEDELEAWAWVDHMLKDYSILGQNYYAYDSWFTLREMGISSPHIRQDTMIQHHAHMPELSKGLGYLASIYCNVPAYKTLRPRGQKADKRDE